MGDRPLLVFENRFAVPPDYAYAWLTDFRPDDFRRLGGDAKRPEVRVTRQGERVVREFATPLGPTRTETTFEPPVRWTTTSETRSRKGVVLTLGRVVETVRPDGAGTLHRAEIYDDPRTVMMRIARPVIRGVMKRDLAKVFATAKREMEAEHAAGKPPTA